MKSLLTQPTLLTTSSQHSGSLGMLLVLAIAHAVWLGLQLVLVLVNAVLGVLQQGRQHQRRRAPLQARRARSSWASLSQTVRIADPATRALSCHQSGGVPACRPAAGRRGAAAHNLEEEMENDFQ
eukprot:456525-Rhodomonas_salina.1